LHLDAQSDRGCVEKEPDKDDQKILSKLSYREKEILALQHLTYGEIAYKLKISESAIRNHPLNITKKTGLNSLQQLGLAIRNYGAIEGTSNMKGVQLSEIEQEVVSLRVMGYMREEIACLRDRGLTTITVQIGSAYKKIGAVNKFDAVIKCVAMGLVDSHELGSRPYDVEDKMPDAA
jgi:DNA-binding NarL/FixJ family response regulator